MIQSDLLPDKMLLQLRGIVPSGSYLTMMIDSLVNGIRCQHLCDSTIDRDVFSWFKVLDDDNLASDGPLTLEDISRWSVTSFPWDELHPEKCICTKLTFTMSGCCVRLHLTNRGIPRWG